MPYSRILNAVLICTLAIFTLHRIALGENPPSIPRNFQTDQLVAWCIVPFDSMQRGPAERAEMIRELALRRVAYDWRAEHVPQFEQEILEYKKHGIEFFAFWSWHDSLASLIKKHDVHPQIWITNPSPAGENQQERIEQAAKQLLPLVEKTKSLGCQLGLYNHGGWGGEPENMIAVCRYLQEKHNAEHVGIVYNFHHGHGHISDFKHVLSEMMPYLLCLNLNGMATATPDQTTKIVTIGEGKFESEMIREIIRSGYQGPIGVLDHRSQLDAKESLKLNLDGLQKVLTSSSEE